MADPRKPKVYKPCRHCGQRHHTFARCADGFRAMRGAGAFGTKERPSSAQAPAAPPSTQPEPPVAPPASEDWRQDLRVMAAALPEDARERRAIESLLARDEARVAHREAEESLQATTGNPDVRLPLPTILRETSEQKGRFLEGELARVMHDAGRIMPTAEEAAQTKAALAAIPAQRDAAESAAREAAAPKEHLNGDQLWICRNPKCGKRFRSASMDVVRAKARAEQEWRFTCPTCESSHVEILDIAAVA